MDRAKLVPSWTAAGRTFDVNGWIKFIIGGVVTSLMALATHSWLGLGPAFIEKLQSQSEAAIGNAGGTGISLTFEHEPALRRIAILSGPADQATREVLLAAVRAVPGVADARWAEEPLATTTAEAPASAEAVDTCQHTVDAAISGKTIQFETGSAVLKPDSQPIIAAVAQALTPCAGVRVEVAGHTDASGAPASNQLLSEGRAASVLAALVAAGVPAERLFAKGYGSSAPKVEGRGATADAANRRIEFHVASTAAADLTAGGQ